jgi:hypothetical protein
MVEITQGELDALIARSYLPVEERGDADTIKKAIEGVISDMAFEVQSERGRARV